MIKSILFSLDFQPMKQRSALWIDPKQVTDQLKLNQKIEGKKTQGLNSIHKMMQTEIKTTGYNYMQIRECKLDYKKI